MIDLLAALGEQEERGPAVELDEALLLYALARALRPRVVLETGTNRGLSALALALGCAPDGQVHTFDIADYGGAAGRRWTRWGVDSSIVFHQCSSLDPPASLNGVQFAFFDTADGSGEGGTDAEGRGVHTEQHALLEWEIWRPRLAPGAVLAWHDATPGSGVARAVWRITNRDPVSLCPLGTGHALVLGVWQPGVWWSERAAEIVHQHRAVQQEAGCSPSTCGGPT